MNIALHNFNHNVYDDGRITALISKSIPHKIAQCLKSAGEFETLIEYCTGVIYSSLQQNNSDPKIIEACAKLILETIKCKFDMAQSASPQIEIHLANQTSTIPKVGHNISLFYSGYYDAFSFRAVNMRNYLDTISYEKHLISYSDYDMFNVCHYDLLRGLGKLAQKDLLREFNAGFKHLYALNRTLTEHQRVFYPLWEYIIREDNKRFNEKLEEALVEHQKLWSIDEENPDIVNNPKGHRNIFLTGIMSYAKDIGFQIDHTSDYTPQYLVNGNVKVDLDRGTEFMFTPKEMTPEEIRANIRKR